MVNLGYVQSRGQSPVAGQSEQHPRISDKLFFSSFSRFSNRYTSKHCLHVSASSPTPVADVPAAVVPLPSDSYIETRPPPNPSSSFTTAYAMLLYNVCYLAHTQAVEIPLSQAGDVLSNLWAVCCSAELGRSVNRFSYDADADY